MSGDPIIEANELPGLVGVRLIDARSQRAFDASHVDGAVRVPVEIWEPKARSSASAFEDLTYWEFEIAALGIESTVPAVVYDDGRMIDASRVWFILQYFGAKVQILNGGWPVIAEAADRVQAAPRPAASDFRAAPGSGSVGLIDRASLKARLNTEVRILDARTTAEYDGEDLRQNARGGHLPGSSLLPHASLLGDGGFRGADELLALLADAGIERRERLVTLCDAGGRAALAAAAAARAGYSDIQIYYPSFSDWARDQSCPVVRSEPVNVGEVTA